MKNNIIVQTLKVDRNLLHLENVIFDLDNYKFDSDIIKLLNELKTLVDKKLFSNLNYNDLDIVGEELFLKFYFKKWCWLIDNINLLWYILIVATKKGGKNERRKII